MGAPPPDKPNLSSWDNDRSVSPTSDDTRRRSPSPQESVKNHRRQRSGFSDIKVEHLQVDTELRTGVNALICGNARLPGVFSQEPADEKKALKNRTRSEALSLKLKAFKDAHLKNNNQRSHDMASVERLAAYIYHSFALDVEVSVLHCQRAALTGSLPSSTTEVGQPTTRFTKISSTSSLSFSVASSSSKAPREGSLTRGCCRTCALLPQAL